MVHKCPFQRIFTNVSMIDTPSNANRLFRLIYLNIDSIKTLPEYYYKIGKQMNQQLMQYISFARDRKSPESDIRANLIAAGWEQIQVEAALGADNNTLLMPPPPPGIHTAATMPAGLQNASPIAVIQQRTTKGLEYTIMFLALGITAISLGQLLHSLVDSSFGANSSSGLSTYASSAILVALPIFAILFLRLKKAENANPTIRTDASRRHAVQLTLIVTFIWGIFRLTTYVYSLLNGGGGDSYLGTDNTSGVANFLHTITTLVIAGGIFAYYWIDEHRKEQG